MLFLAFSFFAACVVVSCVIYAKRNAVTFLDALLALWNEGVVSSFKSAIGSFVPMAKKALLAAWSCVKKLSSAIWEYLKPVPAKHIFAPALFYGLHEAIREYVYAPFQPTIDVRYTPLPSSIYVAFYTKSAITEAVSAEICWHIQAKFQEYLASCGLTFEYTVIPYVKDNFIEVWVYYCEAPAEYPAYRTGCRRAMLMKADQAFRPLPESAVPPTAQLILGYNYEKWKTSGQIAPIAWNTATAPHLLVAGPTGGGKTVYVKMLLERLLLSGADVTVCDYKGFGDLKGFVSDYASGDACDSALSAFCADFEYAKAHGITNRKKVLLFDEFGAFSASKPKKEAAELMRSITSLVTMSRAYGYHIIFVAQRFDAETIDTKLREQFGVRVHMGYAISPQSAGMLFPNAEIESGERLPPYCGYISTPSDDLAVLIVPQIDISALDKRLKMLGQRECG